MSNPGIALDVRLAKDGDARRYCLQQCAKLSGWVVSVDRGGGTMPQLGCVWDPDRALELWADLAAEIATLRAEGWVDAPAPLPPVPQPPSADLRAIIEPFMELLQGSRREFDRVDPTGQLPSDSDLERALGRAKPLWDELIARLASEHGVAVQEWKSYSVKSGWAYRLKRGKRTIVWLAPCDGVFQVAFILGDRALRAAREEGLPARVLRMLDEAPRYPEGTRVRLQIKAAKDIPLVMKLAAIKVQNWGGQRDNASSVRLSKSGDGVLIRDLQ